MAVVQLATTQDVEAALGRDLAATEIVRVETILDKASELFRYQSGQLFTPGTTTARLKVNGGRVFLKQRPVTAVATVVDDDGNDVAYVRTGSWLNTSRLSHEFLTVTYEHGGEVPDLVRLTVADIARKVVSIDPKALTGQNQSTISSGPFSETANYAAWAVGGQTMLSPDDKAIAKSFRVRVPTVWVSQP
ncbi:hypothetical protein [Arthrobacter rhombi]|uniref:hypothetical protein n=1 Tax=Arthrobacter rhombi TaxID=71253 RepID=UPI003FD62FBB